MRSARTAVAALTITALAVTAPAAAASAAQSSSAPPSSALVAAYVPSSCTNQSACLYNKYSFNTGEGYELMPARSAGVCENLTLRNSVTSLFNNGGRTMRVYKNLNCGGDYLTYTNGQSSKNLAVSHPTFQDNIESVKWF